MKLATCEVRDAGRPGRFVAVLTGDGLYVDLAAAFRALAQAGASGVVGAPASMIEFLEGGDGALASAERVLTATEARLRAQGAEATWGPGGERLAYRDHEIHLLAPVPRPGKILHTSCNFDQHLAEVITSWRAPEWQNLNVDTFHHQHPTGFLQAPSAIVGSGARGDPASILTRQLDYEIELAIIIGRQGRYITQEAAMDYVAGFAVFNDISARDMQSREHANRVILLGKSFDTSAPLGPYLVTKDELADPQNLAMELRINGEVRQKASTAEMHYKIRDLVAWWSNITLEPGDVITSGSPPGVAAAMNPPKWLEPGDRIEATIEGLGTLVNEIVDDRG